MLGIHTEGYGTAIQQTQHQSCEMVHHKYVKVQWKQHGNTAVIEQCVISLFPFESLFYSLESDRIFTCDIAHQTCT